ncbi:MAG: pyridoxal kinase PdxY [Alphaproteobacteria bacterium]|nr:pyridoxal kinase PdxY [Alphaproteobacteria bacterium]
MNILAVQSHVAYGHVGNSAAVFALQRLGVEVWPVHTVQFSNHTGYETFRGRAFDAALIRDVVQGLSERGALARCDAVLSGYLGTAEIGEAILDAVEQVKRANPDAVYCCDPVMGDSAKGAFVPDAVADFIVNRTVPAASIVTPNHFELDRIAGRASRTLSEAIAAVDAVRARGPKAVLVTSLVCADTPPDAVDMLACDAAGRHRLRTPRLKVAANGAGDLIAALFLAHHLRSRSASEALSRSASSVFGVLSRASETGEMPLIDAQDELVDPSRMFHAEPV